MVDSVNPELVRRGIDALICLPEWSDIETEVLPTMKAGEQRAVTAAMRSIERKSVREQIPVRVRRGLQRALFAAECELDAIKNQKDYKSCGMTRRQYENFRLAVQWLQGVVS